MPLRAKDKIMFQHTCDVALRIGRRLCSRPSHTLTDYMESRLFYFLPFSPLQLDLLPCSPHSMKPLEICDYFSPVSQVVQTLDSPIHRINHYQVGKPIVLSSGY